MKLKCHPVGEPVPTIVSAPLDRDWMNATSEQFAYRCLPMNIANAHGWMILNPVAFIAEWNGNSDLDAVRVISLDADPDVKPIVVSHFGYGILTFHVHGLFRTEPGFDLIATGPFNQPKDAIQPLTGVVETDWSPSTFTMNWKFTRKSTPVRFEANEAFCMIMPYRRGDLEATVPMIVPMEQEPETKAQYDAWTNSRADFLRKLGDEDPEARAQGWQKDYFRGRDALAQAASNHRTKVRLREFEPVNLPPKETNDEPA